MSDFHESQVFSVGTLNNGLSFSLRQRPGIKPYDFGKFGVTVRTGKFHGSAECFFCRSDFETLLLALQSLDLSLQGGHEFDPIESQLNFSIEIDKLGHLNCSGVLFEKAGGWGASVKFEIEFDQTALKPLIRNLEEFILSFDS